MVIEDNANTVPGSETTLISTLVQNPLQASQDVLATLTTTNILLLLTTGPKFDKIASGAISKNAKSLTSHTEKLPSEEPTSSLARVFPNANESQVDLLLANQ